MTCRSHTGKGKSMIMSTPYLNFWTPCTTVTATEQKPRWTRFLVEDVHVLNSGACTVREVQGGCGLRHAIGSRKPRDSPRKHVCRGRGEKQLSICDSSRAERGRTGA